MFLYACNLQMKKAKFVITNINADIEASTTFDFIRALYTMRSFWLILHELMYVVQRKLLSFSIKWGKCDDYRLKSVHYILSDTDYHESYFTTLNDKIDLFRILKMIKSYQTLFTNVTLFQCQEIHGFRSIRVDRKLLL